MFSKSLIKKSIAEFVGAFAIVFFGCGAIVVGALQSNSILLANVPWVFGGVVSIMIYALGHISGAHFNPAVTLGFAVVKRFPFWEVPIYWGAQFLGGIVAAFLLLFLFPESPIFGATIPSLITSKALFVEGVLTFFLMFVIISVATDSRAVGTMAGLAIGLTVALDAWLGGGLTGASMNPARSLGPALLENRFEYLWIYFLGPGVGACLAALLYEGIRCENSKEKQDAKGCC